MRAGLDGAIAAGLAAAASARGLRIRAMVAGTSMLPAIRPGDILIARPLADTWVREGDIVLFRSGGGLCAHRVVAIRGDGVVTRGDAVLSDDGVVPPTDIVGVVERIQRGAIEFIPTRQPHLGQRAAAVLLRRSSLLRSVAGKLALVATEGVSFMNEQPNPSPPATRPKKAYTKPEIRQERIFETGAMACTGKHDARHSARCTDNKKS